MIHEDRISVLTDVPARERGFVLYWMRHSQRADSNCALEYAIDQANELGQACVALFCLVEDYPDAQLRHFNFMLEGLAETSSRLAKLGIKLVAREGKPWQVVSEIAEKASLIVCDVGYLRIDRHWQDKVKQATDLRMVAVESDVVVPVRVASDKAETAARTLRPKIDRVKGKFLVDVPSGRPGKSSLPLHVSGTIEIDDVQASLRELDLPGDAGRSTRFQGGITNARRRLTRFIKSGLDGYASARNDPADPVASGLSPYLHFGQISPIEIALKVGDAKSGSAEDKQSFLEELIVRRELAVNFVHYTKNYDSYQCVPTWARESLDDHKDDPRPSVYTRSQLENAETEDPYWNAAMREALITGYMHNYMRMYWGKKIIEWTRTPQYAYSTTLFLNNKYFIDGRDANSYANVAWIFGLHDRGWPERDVFGKVRYMNAAGLQRKFDIEKYVSWVNQLEE